MTIRVAARLTSSAMGHFDDIMRSTGVGPSRAFALIVNDLMTGNRHRNINTTLTRFEEPYSEPICVMVDGKHHKMLDWLAKRSYSSTSRTVNAVIEAHMQLVEEDPQVANNQVEVLGITRTAVFLPTAAFSYLSDMAKLKNVDTRTVMSDILTNFARRHGLKGLRTPQSTAKRPFRRYHRIKKHTYDQYGKRQHWINTKISDDVLAYLTDFAEKRGVPLSDTPITLFQELKQADLAEFDTKLRPNWDEFVPNTPFKGRFLMSDTRRMKDAANRSAIPLKTPQDEIRGFIFWHYIHLHMANQDNIAPYTEETPPPAPDPQPTKPLYLVNLVRDDLSTRIFDETPHLRTKYTIWDLGKYSIPSTQCTPEWFVEFRPPHRARQYAYTMMAIWHDAVARSAFREAHEAMRHMDTKTAGDALTAAAYHQQMAEEAHGRGRPCPENDAFLCPRCEALVINPVKPTSNQTSRT